MIRSIACLVLLTLLAISCTHLESDPLEQPADPFAVTSRCGPEHDFPGKIPAASQLNTLALDSDAHWKDFDAYYRNEVIASRSTHYFENLQWATVSLLLQRPDFREQAGTEVKAYYLSELFSREYINNPDRALTFLNTYVDDISTTVAARYAREVVQKNKASMSSGDFERHRTDYQSAYNQLIAMGYTRHGLER